MRRLILDEAAGRSSGAAELQFDVFDVTLDFDAQRATVADVLEADSSEETGLVEFLVTAASFGDDPSIGDGSTAMERRPPRYVVDGGGGVTSLPPPPP